MIVHPATSDLPGVVRVAPETPRDANGVPIVGYVPTGSVSQVDFNALAARVAVLESGVVAPALGVIQPDTVFLGTPNIPKSDTLPTIAGATLSGGLVMAAGAVQDFTVRFSSTDPSANIRTTKDVYDSFYTFYMSGNQTDMNEIVVSTGHPGNDQKFLSRAARTSDTDPARRHQLRPNGLALLASGSNRGLDCTAGRIKAGIIRFPTKTKPPVVLQWRALFPKGKHAWTPCVWLFSGEQEIPKTASTNPYDGLMRFSSGGHAFEIDGDDSFDVGDAARGKAICFGTPDIYGMQWDAPPHPVYAANSNGFTYNPGGQNPFCRLTDIDMTAEFVTFTMAWNGDYIEMYIHSDSKPQARLFARYYYEYARHADTYVDANGVTQTLGLHIIIGNQAVPTFVPGFDTVTDNDGIPDGWTLTVAEVSSRRGTLTPESVAAATVSTNAIPAPVEMLGTDTVLTVGGAGFKWFHKSNGVLTGNKITVPISGSTDGGENVVGLVTPITGDITTLKLQYDGQNYSNYINFGPALCKAGANVKTVQLAVIVPSPDGGAYFQQFAGFVPGGGARAADFGGDDAIAHQVKTGVPHWWRIQRDGDTFRFYFSATGAAGSFTLTLTKTSADLFGPTHIGAYVNPNGPGDAGATGGVSILGYSTAAGSNVQAAAT